MLLIYHAESLNKSFTICPNLQEAQQRLRKKYIYNSGLESDQKVKDKANGILNSAESGRDKIDAKVKESQ